MLIGLHIGFLLICAIFLSFTLSMLSDSKTATGTVTFALTESPELSMDMNFQVKGAEHTTYLGTKQQAEITGEDSILKVNLTQKQEVSVTITVTYADNILIVPNSIITAGNKTLNKISNANGVAVFKTNDGVTIFNGDYIVLDNLLSSIYPTKDATNKSYSIRIETQAGNSVPASAILSGTYTNKTTQYDVTFNIVGGEYGTITGTGIFAEFNSSSTNTYTVPHGTTISTENESKIIFTDPYNNELGSLTATANAGNDEFTYTFSNWSTASGPITANTTLTANFKKTTNQFNITYNFNNVLSTNTQTKINAMQEYRTTLTANEGYILPAQITVQVGSNIIEENNGYEYNIENGELVIFAGIINNDLILTVSALQVNIELGSTSHFSFEYTSVYLEAVGDYYNNSNGNLYSYAHNLYWRFKGNMDCWADKNVEKNIGNWNFKCTNGYMVFQMTTAEYMEISSSDVLNFFDLIGPIPYKNYNNNIDYSYVLDIEYSVDGIHYFTHPTKININLSYSFVGSSR